MLSPALESPQRLTQRMEDDEPRVESLFEKLQRKSLALVRQSEFARELFSARIEELEEQAQELLQQEEFFLARLEYWRQRHSDMEKSKQNAEQRLGRRIEHLIGREIELMITDRELRLHIENQNERIKSLESLFEGAEVSAEDAGSQSEANKTTKEPRPDVDPTPYWLTHNDPRDWYSIALQHSRPPRIM